MHKKLSLLTSWLVLTLLTLQAGPALASGPFSMELLERDLGLGYIKSSYKIYRNQRQATEHRTEMRKELYARLQQALPQIRALLQRLNGKGLALRPLTLALPLVDHDPAKQERIAGHQGPTNLALQVPLEEGTYTLTLSVDAIPPRAVMFTLQKKLTTLLSKPLLQDKIPALPELSRLEAFELLSGKLGVLVGTRAEARPEVAKLLAPQLKALLKASSSQLAQALAKPAWREALGGKLLPLKRAAAKNKRQLDAGLFNFYGPLVDGQGPNLLRGSQDVGLVRVVVVLAQQRYDWGKVDRQLSSTLKELQLQPGR